MDEYEKQVIGYALIAILEFGLPVLVYYVNLLTLNPILVAYLVSVVGIVGGVGIAFIRHRFRIPPPPEEETEPISSLSAPAPSPMP